MSNVLDDHEDYIKDHGLTVEDVTEGFDIQKLEGVSLYGDGSGNALSEVVFAMAPFLSRMNEMKRLIAFAKKYQDELSGTPWGFYFSDTKEVFQCLKISASKFIAEKGDAVVIARLFPTAKWKSRDQKYQDRKKFLIRDWFTEIEGCEIVIDGAEVINLQPVKVPRCGAVNINRKESASE